MTESNTRAPESDPFWAERKAAAVLKHGILYRYLPVFVTKTGMVSRNGRVVYFDGYAGQGRYDDGTVGSPLIAARVAAKVARHSPPRRLELFLVEREAAEYRRLVEIMEQYAPWQDPVVRRGEAGEFVGEVLSFSQGAPLFGLLDPYGLGLPMSTVVTIMNRPRDHLNRPQTEVLINFSDIAVRRVGGLLTTRSPQAGDAVTLARMDDVCGGSWWRGVYESASNLSSGVATVVSRYCELLCDRTGSNSWTVPVRNQPGHEPRYYLVFLTRHPDGMWEFGENLSSALEDWRLACDAADLGVSMQEVREHRLFDSEALLADTWAAELKRNILRLITSGTAPFVVRDRYTEIMGSSLGLARSMHIRRAVKELHERGETASTGKGRVASMVILPPERPQPTLWDLE